MGLLGMGMGILGMGMGHVVGVAGHHVGKMAAMLKSLGSKKEVDSAIKTTEDKVLVLRFGKESDSTCLKLDDIVS